MVACFNVEFVDQLAGPSSLRGTHRIYVRSGDVTRSAGRRGVNMSEMTVERANVECDEAVWLRAPRRSLCVEYSFTEASEYEADQAHTFFAQFAECILKDLQAAENGAEAALLG